LWQKQWLNIRAISPQTKIKNSPGCKFYISKGENVWYKKDVRYIDDKAGSWY
jgi:hypothetical protein